MWFVACEASWSPMICFYGCPFEFGRAVLSLLFYSPLWHTVRFGFVFACCIKAPNWTFFKHMPYAKAFLIIVFPTSECAASGTVMRYFQNRVVFAGSCCTCTLITGQPWHTTPCCVVCGPALRSGSHQRWSKRRGTPTRTFYSLGSLPLKTSGLHWQWRTVHDAWFQTQLEQPVTYWFRDG